MMKRTTTGHSAVRPSTAWLVRCISILTDNTGALLRDGCERRIRGGEFSERSQEVWAASRHKPLIVKNIVSTIFSLFAAQSSRTSPDGTNSLCINILYITLSFPQPFCDCRSRICSFPFFPQPFCGCRLRIRSFPSLFSQPFCGCRSRIRSFLSVSPQPFPQQS